MTPQLPSDVIRVGTDSSNRPIFMTRLMAAFWAAVCADLGFTPTITQGAWMLRSGGGAAASAGFHDGGGCLDLRVWDLTPAQVTKLVATLRKHGAAAWLRNPQHGGFADPHVHFVLGADFGKSSGAVAQWTAYRNGRDGLASNGVDYHPRPNPLVITPPVPKRKPTRAITAALAAKTRDARRASLEKVARSGSKTAKAATARWLASMDAQDKARSELKSQERK